MFIVYHGYVTSDNCDASDGHGPYQLSVCKTEAQVLKLREEHEDGVYGEDRDGDGSDVSRPIFRVFEGVELEVEPKEKVTMFALKRPRR